VIADRRLERTNAVAATAFVIGGSLFWRLDWTSAFVLFVGTLYFGISLLAALIGDLTTAQEHRLVWSPELIGCVLFLVSGHLALLQLRRERRPHRSRGDLGWWIAVVNQVGSALFMVSAIAAFVRPSSGDELAVGIANWACFAGAACFAVAGAMQEFERP
jgi:O-antigen/teichoic acid export membrane protein